MRWCVYVFMRGYTDMSMCSYANVSLRICADMSMCYYVYVSMCVYTDMLMRYCVYMSMRCCVYVFMCEYADVSIRLCALQNYFSHQQPPNFTAFYHRNTPKICHSFISFLSLPKGFPLANSSER